MTISVLDSTGATQSVKTINDLAADGGQATVGITSGVAVTTDAAGTLQQYLRGVVKLIAAKIGITIADGDAATVGITTGTAVTTDASGTVQQYLRGLVKLFATVISSGKVSVDIASISGGNVNGQAIPANSAPVVNAAFTYKTCAASATTTLQTSAGAVGDYLDHVIVFPGTTAAGSVVILDNAVTVGTYAGGGTTALLTLTPFTIFVGAASVSGAWKLTLGANVTAIGVGRFS